MSRKTLQRGVATTHRDRRAVDVDPRRGLHSISCSPGLHRWARLRDSAGASSLKRKFVRLWARPDGTNERDSFHSIRPQYAFWRFRDSPWNESTRIHSIRSVHSVLFGVFATPHASAPGQTTQLTCHGGLGER